MREEDGKVSEHTIWIDASPEEVFKLISSPQEVGVWLCQDRYGHNDDSTIQITESIPGKRVVISWHSLLALQKCLPPSQVEIQLEPEHEGTLVHLTHSVHSAAVLRQTRSSEVQVRQMAGALKRLATHPIVGCSLIDRLTSQLLPASHNDHEGHLAFATGRMGASLFACAIAGLAAVANATWFKPNGGVTPQDMFAIALALLLVLANVFAGSLTCHRFAHSRFAIRLLSSLMTGIGIVVSCLLLVWMASGSSVEAVARLHTWVYAAIFIQCLIFLYRNRGVSKMLWRVLFQPIRWRTCARVVACFAISLCCAEPLFAAEINEPTVADKVDALMKQKYRADEPGAAVLVARDGKVLISRGYGMSNLEFGVPIDGDTPFCIASATKPFTAIATLKLVEQGKLDLDDLVTDVLPDYPAIGSQITVRHLLNHTCGIKDVSRLPEWRSDMRSDLTVDNVLEHFQSLPLMFPPGEKWEYTNSGYLLLGAIIEKVSGQTYAEFVQEQIFEPCKMQHSCFGSAQRLIHHRADGYTKDKRGYVNAEYVSMTRPYSAGGLVCTVNDMNAWSQALLEGKLLKPEMVNAAFTPAELNSGEPTVYGLGWMIGSYHGHRLVQHSGGMPGFTSQMWLLPDEKVFVVLLSNSPDKTDQSLIGSIAGLALGETEERPKVVPVASRVLKRYVGQYRLTSFGNDVVQIQLDSEKLTIHVPPNPVCELHATSNDEFYVVEEDIRVTFVKDNAGDSNELILHHGGLDLRAKRIDEQSAPVK